MCYKVSLYENLKNARLSKEGDNPFLALDLLQANSSTTMDENQM